MPLWGKALKICPECRTPEAERTMLGKVLCRNGSCKNFDSRLMEKPHLPETRQPTSRAELRGSFDPEQNAVVVQYRNFRGEDVKFRGDGTTVRFRKGHLSLRVAPTGRRIALAKKFVRNLRELESRPGIDPEKRLLRVERQVMGYHRKHGTTSPRYEEILRKYPDLNAR